MCEQYAQSKRLLFDAVIAALTETLKEVHLSYDHTHSFYYSCLICIVGLPQLFGKLRSTTGLYSNF